MKFHWVWFPVVLGLVSQQTLQSGDAVAAEAVARAALNGRPGALVILDSRSQTVIDAFPEESARKLPPCSTFKIWNALEGLELGVVSSADEPFYHWDGTVRSIADWNRDLTFKEAFQVSCVPAFQDLARKIGSDRMAAWLHAIGYGDEDTSAGIDQFWLPAEGRKTILISPREQAELVQKLVRGDLPVSERSRLVLRELMLAKKTAKGTLFGKTGTGQMSAQTNVGWYVGYLESGGVTIPFACTLFGEKVMGKDAKAVVEIAFEKLGLL